MAFVQPKPGGWNAQDKLTAAQMNALQAAIVAADADVLTQQALTVRKALASRVLSLHQIIRAGVAITDSAVSMAALQQSQTVPIVAMKIGNAMLCDDADRFVAGGALASITSLVTAAASRSGRICVLGTGGTFGCTSINNGTTWSAFGAGLPSAQNSIIAQGTNFIACALGSANVYRSTTGAAAWSSATLPGGAIAQSLAIVGVVPVALTAAATFCRSFDGGATWSAAAGALPSAMPLEAGCIAGANTFYIFHVGRVSTTQLQVSISFDGLVWTAAATITAPATGPYSGRPRLMMCQNTNLLVIAVPHADGMTLLYASEDLGATWTLPKAVAIAPEGFAVAGGRLFATDGIMLFASAGIGWP